MPYGRGGSPAMAKKGLERIVCDLGPIKIDLNMMMFYKPCGQSYNIGMFCECDIKKYLECRKLYKDAVPVIEYGRRRKED